MNLLKSKILILLVIFGILSGSVNAATVNTIEAIDNNTIGLTASEDVIFSDINVEGDIRLLKDIPVSFSAPDVEDPKKVMINIGSDLHANTLYSLISIFGAEGNIDFTIGEYLEGEIANSNISEGERGIEKINVVDSRTIELFFTYELEDDTFDFKILSDIPTKGLKSDGNNKLTLDVTETLDTSTSYIVMVLTLEDANGVSISFDDELYDFITPATLAQDAPIEEKQVAQVEEEPEVVEEGNMEEVALNSAETPETGTATSLLIAFAVLLNIAIFARKKFIK